MDDLIKRQDAIGKIKDWMKFIGYSHSERNVMECTIQMLEELPSAEPKQKTGKWIQAEDITTEYAVCTNCKGHGEFYMDYCWHCGARMVGEEDV